MANDNPLFPPSLTSAAYSPNPILPKHAAQGFTRQQPGNPAEAIQASPTGFTTANLLDYTLRGSTSFAPVAANFTPNIAAMDDSEILKIPLPAGAKELYDAILNFPGSKASAEEAHIIALTTHYAATDFKVDPKVMLAIFAHESEGFDTSAKSYRGAGGLGQLTGIAIKEVQAFNNNADPNARAKDKKAYPREDLRAQFERADMRKVLDRISKNSAARNDIHDNVWTSVAYARIVMDRATKNGSASLEGDWGMLGRYNASDIASERKAFPGKVSAAYTKLWGSDMPKSLPNP